jgi:hypothetical protein
MLRLSERRASLRSLDVRRCVELVAPHGPMSTLATGEADMVFAVPRDACARVAETGDVVMVVTLSNACPT